MYPSKDHPFYGIFVKNFENQLKSEGFEFEKVVIKGRGRTKIEKLKKYFRFFIDVFRALREDKYDLIYVHYVGHSLLPFLIFKRNLSKPFVVNAHGSDIFSTSKIGYLIQKMITPIIKETDMVVVPSNYFKKIIEEKFSIDRNSIFVSPSGGVNTNLFKPMVVERSKLFTVGFVSRIDKRKGWDTLLEAVNLLKQKKLIFKVLIVGSGAQKNNMLQKIRKLELDDIIEYVGAKPHNELPYYFNKMDILAFTTRLEESLGLVGLEAMACGIPVVGSNIGGLPSYIIDNVNGKLFEPGNSKELANHIEFFMKMNKIEFSKYKTKALETAKKYDSKIVARQLAEKLKEITNLKKTDV